MAVVGPNMPMKVYDNDDIESYVSFQSKHTVFLIAGLSPILLVSFHQHFLSCSTVTVIVISYFGLLFLSPVIDDTCKYKFKQK